jgi:hypothetical protein
VKFYLFLFLSVFFTFTSANGQQPFYSPEQSPFFAESPLLEEASQKPLFYAQSGPFAGILLDSLWAIPIDGRTRFKSSNTSTLQNPYILGAIRPEFKPSISRQKPHVHFIFGNEVGDLLFNELENKDMDANKTPFLGLGGSVETPFFHFYAELDQNDHWSIAHTKERIDLSGFTANTKNYNPEKSKSWFGENLPLISLLKSGLYHYDSLGSFWHLGIQDGWLWEDQVSGKTQLFRIHQWSANYQSPHHFEFHYFGNQIQQELAHEEIQTSQFFFKKSLVAVEQQWIFDAQVYQNSNHIQGVLNFENWRPFSLNQVSEQSNPQDLHQLDQLGMGVLGTQVQFGNHFYHFQNQIRQIFYQKDRSQISLHLSGELANQLHPFQDISQYGLKQDLDNGPESTWKLARAKIEYKTPWFNYLFLPWRYWGFTSFSSDSVYIEQNRVIRAGQFQVLSSPIGSLEQQLEIHWPENNVSQAISESRARISMRGYWQPHLERAWNEVEFLPPLYRGQVQADAYLSTDLSLAARLHWSSPWYLRAWSEKSIRYKPAPNLSVFFNQALFKHKLNAKIAALNLLAFQAQNSTPQHPNGSPDCFRILTGIEASF